MGVEDQIAFHLELDSVLEISHHESSTEFGVSFRGRAYDGAGLIKIGAKHE